MEGIFDSMNKIKQTIAASILGRTVVDIKNFRFSTFVIFGFIFHGPTFWPRGHVPCG